MVSFLAPHWGIYGNDLDLSLMPAVLHSVEKCSDNLVVPTLHQAFKNDYDQEKYLVLRGNSEIFEFIRGGYAPISKKRQAEG